MEPILTGSMLIELAHTHIPLAKINDLGDGLKFSKNEVDNLKMVKMMMQDFDGITLDLLNKWVDREGRGLKQAEELRAIMKQIEHTDGEKVLDMAITNVAVTQAAITSSLPSVPSGIPGSNTADKKSKQKEAAR